MEAVLTLVVHEKGVNDLQLDTMPLEKLDKYISKNFSSEEELREGSKYVNKIGSFLYDNEYYLSEDNNGKIKIVCQLGEDIVYLDPIYNTKEVEKYYNGEIIDYIKEKIADSFLKNSLVYQLCNQKGFNTTLINKNTTKPELQISKWINTLKNDNKYFNLRYVKSILDSYAKEIENYPSLLKEKKSSDK